MPPIERAASSGPPAISSALDGQSWEASQLVAELTAIGRDVVPFDQESLELCASLSAELMKLRRYSEAVSLGFWMRPASVAQMRASFERSVDDGQVAVPRGLAFHVTPANVDTMFAYSWILSLLVGNANIVRLSSRGSQMRAVLLETIGSVLDRAPSRDVAMRNRFVLTDHDEATSRAFSAAADVRVVWGGNETVEHFRRFPIPAHGRDIAFPSRHSLAILDAPSISRLRDAELASLADRFFNDAFSFDQGACSSPRLIVWRRGADAAEAEKAVRRFHDAVVEAVERRAYTSEVGLVLNKMAFATEVAARTDVTHIDHRVNEAHWVRLGSMSDYSRENCGGGLFFEFVTSQLEEDMLALVEPRDQTVTTFGIDSEALQHLARRLNGRGVDRFVPVGQALAFGSTWDGLDLLHELSKRVVVQGGRT